MSGRRALGIGGLAAAGAVVGAYRKVLGSPKRLSWPPPHDAVTPAGAQAATEAFARRRRRSRDAALDFAWSTAGTIEPWAEGVNFFVRVGPRL